MSDLNAKIRKQFEFYFSDANLPFDRYLWNLSKENDGWIPVSSIASFKKMQTLTKDLDVVVAALKEGPLEFIEINDEKNVRRKEPVKDYDHNAQTVYAKSFNPDRKKLDAGEVLKLQDDIQEFFEKHGKVLAVRMRRFSGGPLKGKFKGSVYVEFSSPEEAEKVAAMTLEYNGSTLQLMTK
ncbi:La-domain-containing protein [Hesseltinella vesiculosa]|uniref:La-domain-containing protein n=1 Tax=Hesseltinella vesiculosa TaxID=101127 RepID=A0A1X2G3N4_9FUNG|nr:La-domain-containing protein [Hesseltinella vesiculosa]